MKKRWWWIGAFVADEEISGEAEWEAVYYGKGNRFIYQPIHIQFKVNISFLTFY